MKRKMPYNIVKEILKENVKEDICKESIIYVNEFLDDVLFKISKSIEEEHQISNKERMYYNLPIKKRIDKSILKKVLDSLFKTTSGFKIREVGQNNIDTTFLKANVEVVWNG